MHAEHAEAVCACPWVKGSWRGLLVVVIGQTHTPLVSPGLLVSFLSRVEGRPPLSPQLLLPRTALGVTLVMLPLSFPRADRPISVLVSGLPAVHALPLLKGEGRRVQADNPALSVSVRLAGARGSLSQQGEHRARSWGPSERGMWLVCPQSAHTDRPHTGMFVTPVP